MGFVLNRIFSQTALFFGFFDGKTELGAVGIPLWLKRGA